MGTRDRRPAGRNRLHAELHASFGIHARDACAHRKGRVEGGVVVGPRARGAGDEAGPRRSRRIAARTTSTAIAAGDDDVSARRSAPDPYATPAPIVIATLLVPGPLNRPHILVRSAAGGQRPRATRCRRSRPCPRRGQGSAIVDEPEDEQDRPRHENTRITGTRKPQITPANSNAAAVGTRRDAQGR